MMRAPSFWRGGTSAPWPALLSPLASLYGAVQQWRWRHARPARPPLPVICVGNVTAGGAGKTPTAIAIARRLIGAGHKVHFLSRGYGGRLPGPLRVDAGKHSAGEVGDEPLLLAQTAPCWIARDRLAGAAAAHADGAEIVIMDDGFQNPTIAKDIHVLVIDGGYGFGNGRLLPAGPLREPPASALERSDCIVWIEDPLHRDSNPGATLGGVPVFRARIVPSPSAMHLSGQPVHAFAGIGRPEKFFATLHEMGCDLRAATAFADHHSFSPEEIIALVEAAAADSATLVCTEKDWLRLPADARIMATPVPIALQFEAEDSFTGLIAARLKERRQAREAGDG